jgi:hypothetical protein
MSRRVMTAFGVGLALAGCWQGSASSDPPSHAAAAPAAPTPPPGCGSESLRPATAAPAEGLWVSEEDSGRQRVAAMVGPSQTEAGSPRITRHIETVELHGGAGSIRHRLDSASLRLEILPPFGERGAPPDSAAPAVGAQPAGVYAVAPLILLASYEPCAASARTPRIRYLRRDAHGAVVTDVMLRRESGGP